MIKELAYDIRTMLDLILFDLCLIIEFHQFHQGWLAMDV